MRIVDERVEEKLRSQPLTRAEADDIYGKRRAIVFISNLWLLGLGLACLALGFSGWQFVLGAAGLSTCVLLPLSLHLFRRELEIQVRAGSPDEP